MNIFDFLNQSSTDEEYDYIFSYLSKLNNTWYNTNNKKILNIYPIIDFNGINIKFI